MRMLSSDISAGPKDAQEIPKEEPVRTPVDPPSTAQLHMLCLASGLPFVGFGFLDNFLMIVCGELIDNTFCVMFSFSTMAAAAMGNTISDVAGIFSSGFVSNVASRFGVEEPPLEHEQKSMGVTQRWQYGGQVVGIVTGCILGCCPLLWMDPNEGERLKRKKERDAIFDTVIKKVGNILGAEAISLMLLDKERGDLYSTHESTNLPKGFRWSTEGTIVGNVAKTGKFVNVADVRDEPLYNPGIHDNMVGTGIRVKSILCMPIFTEGEVAGVVLLVNKVKGGVGFSSKDEDVLSAICSHISVAMGDEKQTFEEVVEVCERSMKTTGHSDWNSSVASQRMRMLYGPALEGVTKVLNAQASALMLLDQESQELYTEVIDGPLPHHRTAVGEGVAGEAVERGKTVNVDERDRSWYDEGRHNNYQGSGLQVSSELVAPLFDTSRKCLGVLKCINKQDGPAFSKDDIAYINEVAQHIGMMLEGPDAGLRRVLALSRKRMQLKDVIKAEFGDNAIICNLDRATGLPIRAEEDSRRHRRRCIDPYVTFTITRGNPLVDEVPGLQDRALFARSKDRTASVRRFAKSNTILQETEPRWDESIAISKPPNFQDVPKEELYIHCLVWDYETLGTDELVAQASFPVADVLTTPTKARPFQLHPILGQETLYDLSKTKIWVSFNTVKTVEEKQ